MVPALGCDDFLLDESHKPLALRQGQTQIRNVAEITGQSSAIASTLRLDPSIPVSTRRKTHPIPDPQPLKPTDRSYPVQPSSPNLAAVST
jgi:hypothetical protein